MEIDAVPKLRLLTVVWVMWIVCLSVGWNPLQARDLFVDNLLGDDLSTGEAPQSLEGREGPVRTIAMALRLCRGSDTIHLANNPLPYFETISISGRKLFNHDLGGLTIDGHGATLSGVFQIPVGSWRHRLGGLWELHPHRKAYYQLIRHDRAVPELQFELQPGQFPVLPPGMWTAWQGVIYYQARAGEGSPENLPLGLAARDAGVTIHDVPSITIRNVTFRHYRLDGIQVNDRARDIVLENVRSLENGRSGLAVGGSCQVLATGCQFSRNRVAAVLNSEVAQTRLEQCEVTPGQSGSPFALRGGRLIVDGNLQYELSHNPRQVIYGTNPLPGSGPPATGTPGQEPRRIPGASNPAGEPRPLSRPSTRPRTGVKEPLPEPAESDSTPTEE